MSGSSGSTQTTPTSSTSATLPWAKLQPYLIQGYQEAAKNYAAGPTQYTPWSQTAGLTTPQQQAISGVEQYVSSPAVQQALQSASGAVQGLVTGAGNQYAPLTQGSQSQLSGYLGANRLYDPSQGINRLMYQNTQDPALLGTLTKGLSTAESGFNPILGTLQNPNISQNLASKIAGIGRVQTTANILSDAYKAQNVQRMQASDVANKIQQSKAQSAADILANANKYSTSATGMGLQYANPILNAPLALLGELNRVGGYQQTANQAQLDDATARWYDAQDATYKNLAKYRNMIQVDPSWGVTNTTGTQSTYTPSSGNSGLGSMAGTLAGAGIGFMMGGPAGAMLGSSLGGAGGGMIGSAFK